jgi:hypothetical protein
MLDGSRVSMQRHHRKMKAAVTGGLRVLRMILD